MWKMHDRYLTCRAFNTMNIYLDVLCVVLHVQCVWTSINLTSEYSGTLIMGVKMQSLKGLLKVNNFLLSSPIIAKLETTGTCFCVCITYQLSRFFSFFLITEPICFVWTQWKLFFNSFFPGFLFSFTKALEVQLEVYLNLPLKYSRLLLKVYTVASQFWTKLVCQLLLEVELFSIALGMQS